MFHRITSALIHHALVYEHVVEVDVPPDRANDHRTIIVASALNRQTQSIFNIRSMASSPGRTN